MDCLLAAEHIHWIEKKQWARLDYMMPREYIFQLKILFAEVAQLNIKLLLVSIPMHLALITTLLTSMGLSI